MDYEYNDYELVSMVCEKNEDAFDILLKKYEPLIYRISSFYAKKYQFLKLEFEDFVQEGRVAIYSAAEKFNHEKNVLFYTYAITSIHSKMKNLIRNACTYKNMALSLATEMDDLDFIFKEENRDLISELFFQDLLIIFKNSLTFEEAQIFELRLHSFSYQEISELLELKQHKVIYLMAGIRKKFKNCLLHE